VKGLDQVVQIAVHAIRPSIFFVILFVQNFEDHFLCEMNHVRSWFPLTVIKMLSITMPI
jgi:hypothetical protein